MSLPIEKAILTLTKDVEIDNCLRETFWDLCIQLPWWRRHHNEIFADIVHQIRDAGRTLRQVTEEPDGHVMIRAITIEGRWVARMKELHRNAIVREENYDIVDGIATLKWWGQFASCEDGVIHDYLVTQQNNERITTNVYQTKYTQGKWVTMSEIEIREYDDRFEEIITIDHPEYHDYEEIRRVIFKRDLFREEYHTIPFLPIHLEMLYSLDVPKWFINEARRAHGHFESLVKD